MLHYTVAKLLQRAHLSRSTRCFSEPKIANSRRRIALATNVIDKARIDTRPPIGLDKASVCTAYGAGRRGRRGDLGGGLHYGAGARDRRRAEELIRARYRSGVDERYGSRV